MTTLIIFHEYTSFYWQSSNWTKIGLNSIVFVIRKKSKLNWRQNNHCWNSHVWYKNLNRCRIRPCITRLLFFTSAKNMVLRVGLNHKSALDKAGKNSINTKMAGFQKWNGSLKPQWTGYIINNMLKDVLRTKPKTTRIKICFRSILQNKSCRFLKKSG